MNTLEIKKGESYYWGTDPHAFLCIEVGEENSSFIDFYATGFRFANNLVSLVPHPDMEQATFNRSTAQQLMRLGFKVTHRHFTPYEWMTMAENKVLTEDGCRHDFTLFWFDREGAAFDEGYSVWIHPQHLK